jgi:hypothetical protein
MGSARAASFSNEAKGGPLHNGANDAAVSVSQHRLPPAMGTSQLPPLRSNASATSFVNDHDGDHHAVPRYTRPRFADSGSERLYDLLSASPVDLGDTDAVGVRGLVWRGVAHLPLRPFAWRAMFHYPHSASGGHSSYAAALQRRLMQYRGYIEKYFDPRSSDGKSERLPQELAILHQLNVDLPRHTLSLYHHPGLRERLQRALFIWSVRHPATSYVQGFDDLVCVFYTTFLTERLALAMARQREQHRENATMHRTRIAGGRLVVRSRNSSSTALDEHPTAAHHPQQQQQQQPSHGHAPTSADDLVDALSHLPLSDQMAAGSSASLWDAANRIVTINEGPRGVAKITAAFAQYGLTDAELDRAETDTYYCAGTFLEWVQHHYIHGTPGINAAMQDIEALVRRVDPEFGASIDALGIACSTFLYPWVHCFFVRFVPAALAPRLMDTFLAIGSPFPHFHVYLCAALLLSLKPVVTERPMEYVLPLLQRPTTFEGDVDAGKEPASPVNPSAAGVATPFTASGRAAVSAGWLDALISSAFLLSLRDTAGVTPP